MPGHDARRRARSALAVEPKRIPGTSRGITLVGYRIGKNRRAQSEGRPARNESSLARHHSPNCTFENRRTNSDARILRKIAKRTHPPPAAHRLPALSPHGTQAGDGVLRDLKGKPVRVSAQFRRCPRNCRRRACSEVPLGDAREGGARRRAASQETCRRLDHPNEPGGVHRRRQRCAIPFSILILWA